MVYIYIQQNRLNFIFFNVPIQIFFVSGLGKDYLLNRVEAKNVNPFGSIITVRRRTMYD